ncbi:hypothetical protein [Candidatus Liberibacter sp.]|uniref:hypothetical protein n=1 Tax=Candidatus Liberibacter sp. TaxID=34022 RepID=UPI0015F67E0A|nr:hypothetical protein [Candidatus Liberibacter sp.]MBA5724073.1 hypothetical protein [Candidatus Liberibacter sp.]
MRNFISPQEQPQEKTSKTYIFGEDKHILEHSIWITSEVYLQARRKTKILNVALEGIAFSSMISVVLFSVVAIIHEPTRIFNIGFALAYCLIGIVLWSISRKLHLAVLSHKFFCCYLDLKNILNHPRSFMEQEYNNILSKYPDPTPYDYEDFLIFHSGFKGKTVLDSLGNPVRITVPMWISWILRQVFLWGFPLTLVSCPLVYLFFVLNYWM